MWLAYMNIWESRFIEKSKIIHEGVYNYSKVVYIKNTINVCIICPVHKEFLQTPANHLRGSGCIKCYHESLSLSKSTFIEKSNLVHNNRYDYSKVVYKNNKTKVLINCHLHGDFLQNSGLHLVGSVCPSCVDRTTSPIDYINRCNIIHKNKYDYSKMSYTGINNYINIICDKHGKFTIRANNHLNLKQGCRICGFKMITQSEFIDKCIERYGDKFDYSKSIFTGINKKIIIICSRHGEFKQTPYEHLNCYNDCPKCSYGTLTTEEFVSKSRSIHSILYDYTPTNYINTQIKVDIKCYKHGTFTMLPYYHLCGYGCPKCNMTIGENKISKYLMDNDIEFSYQKMFDGLRNKLPLKFDFYLPLYNLCVEFDGELHYKSIEHFGGNKTLNSVILNDSIKNKFCIDNNIDLLRIKYDMDIIETISSYLGK